MKLTQIMTTPVIGIDPDATLSGAIRLMEESGRGFLPVIRDLGVVGVVTARDIATKGIGHGMAPEKAHVSQVMSSPVRTVSCDLEAEDAAILMRLHRVRRLVATDLRGEPVGVIALADLAGTLPDDAISETLHLFSVPLGPYEVRSQRIPDIYIG